MAPEDQGSRYGEKRFEDVLARHLRRAATNAGDLSLSACPDAEILAAYHERSLAPEEMSPCKEHVAACARCQNVLAALEETENIPARMGEQEEPLLVAPMAASDTRSEASSQESGEESGRAAAVVFTAAERQREARQRAAYWRWLAPAGAIAAGILMWVTLHEKTSPPKPGDLPSLVAQRQSAPVVEQEKSPGQAKVLSDKGGEHAAADSRAGDKLSTAKNQTAGPAKRAKKEAQPRRAFANSAPVRGVPATQPQNEVAEIAGSTDALREKSVPVLIEGTLEKKPDEAQAGKRQPAAAPSPPPAQAAQVAGIAGQPEPSGVEFQTAAPRADAKKKEAAEFAAKIPAPGSVAEFRDENSPLARRARKAEQRIITAPGGKVLWSVGPSGLIFRSADGGQSWMQQASGVSADLVAGSVPSDTVCWVVGKNGTVLLTTDGERWKKVSSPTTADLAGVSAEDARIAAVWSDARLPRYVTQDGGQSWTQRGTE